MLLSLLKYTCLLIQTNKYKSELELFGIYQNRLVLSKFICFKSCFEKIACRPLRPRFEIVEQKIVCLGIAWERGLDNSSIQPKTFYFMDVVIGRKIIENISECFFRTVGSRGKRKHVSNFHIFLSSKL
jgi:hypothetical protein